MDKKRLEWKVGLFVFIGLALLAALLLQFSKGMSFFRPTYYLYVTAKNVGGLKQGADVLMAGVPVGKVAGIQLNSDGKNVTIRLRIYSQYGIHNDARFIIEQSGFLGDQFVAIVPTENAGKRFVNGDHTVAQEPFNLQEVARSAAGFIQRVDETARQLNDIISDVRRLVLNDQNLTNLSVTVNTMRTVSEHALGAVDNINTLIESNSPSVMVSVSNIVFFSDQINQFANTFGGVLATNSTQLSASMKNIESSTVVLKNLLDEIQSGKGLAGTVLQDKTLAANVAAIANNLSVTTSNLNRLGLWGILWAKKPPKTNPPEKPVEPPKHPLN